MSRPVTEVAVGVVFRPDGSVLLADRPPGKAYAGYWEFPGGKVERGESVAEALGRELREELDLRVVASVPWCVFEFDYPHAYVRLNFRRIFDFMGEPRPQEGQRAAFFKASGPWPEPLLPAAVPVLRWLALPDCLAMPAGLAELRRLGLRGREVCAAGDLVPARPGDPACDYFWIERWPAGPAGEALRAALGRTPCPCYLPPTPGQGNALDAARRAGGHGLLLNSRVNAA